MIVTNGNKLLFVALSFILFPMATIILRQIGYLNMLQTIIYNTIFAIILSWIVIHIGNYLQLEFFNSEHWFWLLLVSSSISSFLILEPIDQVLSKIGKRNFSSKIKVVVFLTFYLNLYLGSLLIYFALYCKFNNIKMTLGSIIHFISSEPHSILCLLVLYPTSLYFYYTDYSRRNTLNF